MTEKLLLTEIEHVDRVPLPTRGPEQERKRTSMRKAFAAAIVALA